MANYNVTITDGTGSQVMQRGTYAVTAEANGYDVSSLTPTAYTATDSEGSQAFTLSANGALTINVNETGAEGGTPVAGGAIVMTNADGSTEYGQAVTVDASGNAVFENVPYGTTAEPFQLYFKQLTTAEGYNTFDGVISVSMTAQTQTEYVQNTAAAEQTFTLRDANYDLPIDGSLTFTENG